MIDISRFLDNSVVLKHVNSLSFNRKASTKGEKKTINYIQNELADGNIKNHAELFEWRDISILRPILLVNLWCIIFYEIILLLFDINWLLIILTILIIFLSITAFDISINSTHFSLLGKKKQSRNIIGEISAQNIRFKRPLIIFSAHHESTIKNYSQKVNMLIFFINFIIIIIYLCLIMMSTIIFIFNLNIHEIFLDLLKIISLIIGIIFLIAIMLLYFNKKTQDSDTLVNSLSGTAILIELAKKIRKDPLTHIDVIFLWTGAEKFGLWGIKNYCMKHFFSLYDEYDLDNSYHFNVDKIGNIIGLAEKIGLFKRKQINENLNAILMATAKSMNINITKITLPGLLPHHFKIFKKYSDNARKKFQVSCFSLFQTKKQELSEKDVLKDVLTDNLNNCLNLCYNTVKSMDKRIE